MGDNTSLAVNSKRLDASRKILPNGLSFSSKQVAGLDVGGDGLADDAVAADCHHRPGRAAIHPHVCALKARHTKKTLQFSLQDLRLKYGLVKNGDDLTQPLKIAK